MAITVGDIVTVTGTPTRYRVACVRHGRALITPLISGPARIVPVSRLARAAVDPITT
ncbi:hypothetical protein [Nocardia otitidiscaviarum]|uniref:hypothetical protein n=1 Tax=Nocardia otitidiscaviarum TaxID=1823 RepID=UPI0024581319|nr:hypothetical protein [Nocardia otitidiscaviarum]